MPLRDSEEGWGWLTRLLHWATAAIILFLIGLGLYMVNVRMDLLAQFRLVQLHKSWGFVVFALGLARVAWLLARRGRPPLPEGPRWRRVAARISHWTLYVLIFALPLSGWLMVSASPLQDSLGIENEVFGLFALPDPYVPGDKALEAAFRTLHHRLALALGLVLVVHAGAALAHHLVWRDGVLRRMIRGR